MTTFDKVVTNPASGGAYFATDQYTDGADTVNMPVSAPVFGPQGGPYTIVSSTDPLPVELLKFGGTSVTIGQTTKSASIPVVLPSDQTIPVSGTITADIGNLNGIALESTLVKLPVTRGASSTGVSNVITGGVVTTSAPTYTNNTVNSVSLTTSGAIRTDSSATTQPVSGTVSASQSGTWNVNNISGTITLPTGASTLSEQQSQTTSLQLLDDTVITNGSGSAAKSISIAGYDGTNYRNIKTDSSGVISANISTLPSIPSGSNIIGAVTQSGSWNVGQTGTWTVDIGTAPTLIVDGSGVVQPVSGTVTANIGTTGDLALDATVNKLNISQGAAKGTNTGPLVQGLATTSAPTYTNNTINPVSITATGAMRVDGSAVTQPVSGTVSAAQSGTWNINNISGTITLPTGSATLSEQQTQTTSLQLIDDSVATVGSAATSKVIAVGGTDGTNSRQLKTDSSGVLSTNVASLPALPSGSNIIGAVTQSGSWNVGQTGTWTTQINQGGNTAAVTAANALKVDGSGVTQPVSGTVAASQSGTWNINNIGGSVSLPTGAATLSEQQTQTTSLQLIDDVVGSTGSAIPSKANLIAGSDGTNLRAISTNTSGQVAIHDGNNSITVDNAGTFAVQAAQSGTWNISNISGSVSLPTGAATLAEQQTQTTSLQLLDDVVSTAASAAGTKGNMIAGTDGTNARLVSTNTSGHINIADGGNSITVDQSGTWTVQPGNTANTTPWLTTINQGGNSAVVSGTGALKVDNSAVTQPISAASLPLPSGASTAAKQPALGVAGTASSDVITVQGIASMTPLLIDGSGITQPVSGPLTDTELRASPVSVSVSGAVSSTVQGVVSHDAAVSTTKPVILGGYASSSAPSAVSGGGDACFIWCDLNGRLQIGDGGGQISVDDAGSSLSVDDGGSSLSIDDNGSTISVDDGGGSLTVDGTVAVTGTFWQATQPVSIAASVAVTGPLTDTQLRATAVPVSLASVPSHQVTNAGTFAVQAAQDGTWTVQPGNTANTTPWLTSIHDGTTKAEVIPLTNYNGLAVAIVDGNGSQITSFAGGGGTQYTEDTASTGGESLTLAGAVRRDTAASSSTTDGDYSTINTDSTGCLWTRVKTVDGGGVASGAADSGNPIKVGGKYNATLPTLTDGNRGDLQLDSSGRLVVVQNQKGTATANWTSANGVGTTLVVDAGGASYVFVQWYSSGTAPVVTLGISQDGSVYLTPPRWYSFSSGYMTASTATLSSSNGLIIPTYGAKYVRLYISTALTGGNTTDVYMASTNATNPFIDTELPNPDALADAMNNPTTTSVGSHMLGYNGSTWDRVKTVNTGQLRSTLYDSVGGAVFPAAAASADGTSNPTVTSISNFPMRYNGSTWDRVYGNVESTLLASAARTSTTGTSNQTNRGALGVHIILRVTVASGTGGLSVLIYGIDPVSGVAYQLNAAPTAVTTTGIFCYEIHPGAVTAGVAVPQRTSGRLPRSFTVTVSHGDASSYTYSLGQCLLFG